MIMKANFDIYTQCPQVYIYIISIILSTLVYVKFTDLTLGVVNLISGIIGVIILMGINYCDWNFQFITWFFSFIFILNIIVNTYLLLFVSQKEIE